MPCCRTNTTCPVDAKQEGVLLEREIGLGVYVLLGRIIGHFNSPWPCDSQRVNLSKSPSRQISIGSDRKRL